MKIAVDMGHCPKSTGASGYLNELNEDRRIGYELISVLKSRGHTVVNVTPGDSEAESLTGRARRANNAGADKFISIHLNAGGGTGTECYTTASSKMKSEAAQISANVAKCLGIRNRGHKIANYTVIAKTNMAACLLEVCFVDNETDYEAFKKTSYNSIANAIADGIEGKSYSGATTPSSGSSASSGSSSTSSGSIAVDGKWGSDTTLKLQQCLGAPYKDGVISRQNINWKSQNPGLTLGWEWKTPPVTGSQTIALLQKKIGADPDGVAGPNTFRALQKYLGTYVDGVVDYPSNMVKEMQRRLNAGTF